METPKITDAHYEAIGRMIISMPDRNDEVKCLQVKELFDDEETFDIINGEWNFNARTFLEKNPYIEQAVHFATKIAEISNPPQPIIIPEDSEIISMRLGENTGGNVINDIIKLRNGYLVVIFSDGVAVYKNEEAYGNGNDLRTIIFE